MEKVIKRFEELTSGELYEILRVRSEVFVVEQNCIYQDLDERDQNAYHIFFHEEGKIKAYLRILEPGVRYEETTISRVLTIDRGTGLGKKLLIEGIAFAREVMKADKITIEAQSYAKGFYEKVGFRQTSGEFLEDGIPHIMMQLQTHE